MAKNQKKLEQKTSEQSDNQADLLQWGEKLKLWLSGATSEKIIIRVLRGRFIASCLLFGVAFFSYNFIKPVDYFFRNGLCLFFSFAAVYVIIFGLKNQR